MAYKKWGLAAEIAVLILMKGCRYLIIICKTIKEFETTIIWWCEPQLYFKKICASHILIVSPIQKTQNSEWVVSVYLLV